MQVKFRDNSSRTYRIQSVQTTSGGRSAPLPRSAGWKSCSPLHSTFPAAGRRAKRGPVACKSPRSTKQPSICHPWLCQARQGRKPETVFAFPRPSRSIAGSAASPSPIAFTRDEKHRRRRNRTGRWPLLRPPADGVDNRMHPETQRRWPDPTGRLSTREIDSAPFV